MQYSEFLKQKAWSPPIAQLDDIPQLNNSLFDFQRSIVSWAIRRGRSAIFADTGLGKSIMELSWADALAKSGRNVLILTPLAVASQMQKEAVKFNIEAAHVKQQTTDKIQITNYEKIDHFNRDYFDAIILDESSILKNYTGKFRTKLIEFAKDIPFRLAATATPSPNDYMELGNHAEFLGIMSYTDMLSMFFTHDGSSTQNWRLKGHAEVKFWEWMAGWSVFISNPSDIGFDGDKFVLPNLNQEHHIVDYEYKPSVDTGSLFPMAAQTMSERLAARRATIEDRVLFASNIVNNDKNNIYVVWCNLNDESSMLAKSIDGAVELRGSDKDDKKEDVLDRFANGEIRVLVTKPSICGFGMNWQHCNNTVFVGLNDSYEQVYQAIRRFWRFGQKKEVTAHFIASEIEGNVVANLKRKEKQAEHMKENMLKFMRGFCEQNIKQSNRQTTLYKPEKRMEKPAWL